MAGAVKLNPSFNAKIEDIITNYLNKTFELWYIAHWASILIKKDIEYDDIECLKKNIKRIRKKYQDKRVRRLSGRQIEETYEEFKKMKTIETVYKRILSKYDINTSLNITKDDIPNEYLKILTPRKLNVKFSISTFNHSSAYGIYLSKHKKIIISIPNIFKEYDSSINNLKNQFMYIIRHEYIHHMQQISNYVFAMPGKYDSLDVYSLNFSTEADYAKHASQNVELYPLIDTYASMFQPGDKQFNPETYKEFLKNYDERFKLMQQINPKNYKIFMSALYSELERRYTN